MTTVVVYVLFTIVYMVACVLDGPDVKPLWKESLGKAFERWANRLHPIKYCDPLCPYPMQCDTMRRYITRNPEPALVESHVEIGEYELCRAQWEEREARRTGRIIPKSFTEQALIDNAKEICVKEIFSRLRHDIFIDVDRESRWPACVVNARLVIRKDRP